MPSRRAFLAAASSVSFTITGCLDRLSDPSFSKGSGLTTRRGIFSDGRSGWNGRPFRADVFATPDELTDALNGDVLSRAGYDDYTEFDPDQEFAAIFASKLELTPSGVTKGWCPRSTVDGDRFTFHVPLADWPAEFDDSDTEWVRLNRWRRNRSDPPTRAVVEVQLVEKTDDEVKTCSD